MEKIDNQQSSIQKILFGHDKSSELKPIGTIEPTESTESSKSIETTTNKKSRIGFKRFAPETINILRNSFESNPYPDYKEVERIADLTDCTKLQITRWFCTNRYVKKNHIKKMSSKPVRFNPQVKKYLNQAFDIDPYPNNDEINNIADIVGSTKKKIKRWFTNTRFFRRSRFSEEEEEIMLAILGERDHIPLDERLELAKRFDVNVRYIEYWLTNHKKNRMMI